MRHISDETVLNYSQIWTSVCYKLFAYFYLVAKFYVHEKRSRTTHSQRKHFRRMLIHYTKVS
jgi:hypothetical protein